MNISSKKKILSEPSSFSESRSFPSVQNDTNIKYLLHVCYMEWLIMGILTLMIMVKMTNLEQEEWLWLKIFSGMLSIFSIPFTVGVHMHNDPSCDSEDHHSNKDSDDKDDFKSAEDSEPEEESKKIEPSSKKKKPKLTLIKKPAKKAEPGKSEKSKEDESSSSSAEADFSSDSSSRSTKVTNQKKRSKGLKKKKRTARKTTKKTSSSKSSSSTSSQSAGSHDVKTEVIIKKEHATDTGSEEDNKMEADVQAKVVDDPKVEIKTEGESDKVTAGIAHGSDADMKVDTKKKKK